MAKTDAKHVMTIVSSQKRLHRLLCPAITHHFHDHSLPAWQHGCITSRNEPSSRSRSCYVFRDFNPWFTIQLLLPCTWSPSAEGPAILQRLQAMQMNRTGTRLLILRRPQSPQKTTDHGRLVTKHISSTWTTKQLIQASDSLLPAQQHSLPFSWRIANIPAKQLLTKHICGEESDGSPSPFWRSVRWFSLRCDTNRLIHYTL